MIQALLTYQFLQRAVLACFLASIVCGIIGVIVVEKKLLMMTGGIAHTALGGVGLGYLLGFEPILGAAAFSTAAAIGTGFVSKKGGKNTDITIAMFWSLGMALGVLFIAFMKRYPPDLNSYLFGNILTVTSVNLYIMAILTLVSAVIIFTFFDDWKAWLFDSEFASISGMKTSLLEYTLFILIALSVVVLLRVAGIILVIALLSVPAAAASLFTNKLETRMVFASVFGIFACFSGLYLSYRWNIPSGAAIIVVSVSAYLLLSAGSAAAGKTKKHKNCAAAGVNHD